MIKIDCNRDEKGFYELDGLSKDKHVVVLNAVQPDKNNSENFWCYSNYADPVLVKFRSLPAYVFALYAELLCEGVCKQNCVRSADIDVGKFKGQYCVLSKSVSAGYDEVFDARKLISLGILWLENPSYFEGDNLYKQLFFADYLFEIAQSFSEVNPEITLDKNFLFDLYKIAFVDLMCNQKDRNTTNILFGIKKQDDKKILSVLPMIDNEYSFEFFRLLTLYSHYKINPNERDLGNENHKRVFDAMNQEFMRASKYSTPIFGTKDYVDLFRIPASLNCEDEKYNLHRAMASSIRDEEFENMAEIICKNPKMREFYQNFSVDMQATADDVKAKTGFEIPQEYVQMTQAICEDNYCKMQQCVKKLDRKYKNIFEEESKEQ